jgi:hypothetical protein
VRHVCFRVARHNDALHTVVVDLIATDEDSPVTCPPFPAIASDVSRIFSLTPQHVQILMALYALEDIEAMSNMMRQATHRTQMNLLADAAEIDLTTFVQETAPGAHLERLGLIGYRGGRDEIADINVSRPLLFALRSNTLDDLKAGLFDATPAPQFTLSEFSLSLDEMRTCAAAARIITAELDVQELPPADVRDRITGYIDQISTGALAHDVRRLPTVATSFDPRFCSTSESLDRVERQAVHRAHTGSGLRLLFGGPPGGGKTQYALWLAKRLGRDVMLKRPSDLLSKYVGESEQQIAAAFTSTSPLDPSATRSSRERWPTSSRTLRSPIPTSRLCGRPRPS